MIDINYYIDTGYNTDTDGSFDVCLDTDYNRDTYTEIDHQIDLEASVDIEYNLW